MQPERAAQLAIAADRAEFRRASAWLHTVCAGYGMPEEKLYALDICLDETLANVVAHGGSAASALPIAMSLTIDGTPTDGQVILTICAGGVAFDPHTHQMRPVPMTLEDAEPGGLGIHMMKTYADELRYTRDNERNCTGFVVRWRSNG